MNAPDLHVHSTFSTLDGMGTPKAVVEQAVKLEWGAVCLTEHGWMGSALPLYQLARENKINPIIGCELYVVSNEILGEKGKEYRAGSYHLTVLALSAEGYHNLVAWTTEANRPENFYYKPRISLERMAEIAPHSLHHNVVLSGCLGGELCCALAESPGHPAFISYIDSMKSLFSNFYIELQHHAHPKFMDKGFTRYDEMIAKQADVTAKLLVLAEATKTPVIVTNDSHYQEAAQRKAHFTMISEKQRVHLSEYGYFTNYMQSMERIADRASFPQEAIDSALAIGQEANIRLAPLDDFSYSIPFSGYRDPIEKIRKRSNRRLRELRKTHDRREVDARFEMELGTMGDFAHYLLIMSDFIRHAKQQGILTNTRGSAANSLVCYCLGIHDLDPMPGAYDLLFSRFVNPARKKLPDIDIDIEKDRFEDFMRYVQEYMAEREGEGQVVQICNYGTLANRSTFRMVAEALGMPKEEQDDISKLLPQMIDSGMVDEENDVYEALREEYPALYELASEIFDSIKNVSQHACGWLFGTADRPIEDWIPLTLIASSGSLVTQYNHKILDDIGLVKGDFLRLKTLSVIQRTRKLLGHNSLDITDIPLDDEATFEMLREGRTEGVFTLQGKENRKGVMETEASTVHDVIKAVAIYRPALTRDHKHTAYNRRRLGEEEVRYSHPFAEKILGPTYGIPVFQEQVMELCYAAGMTDAEVDDVYKAIKLAKGVGRGAKEAFAAIEPVFIARAKASGFSPNEILDYWEDIKGSQGYGFNKGHATSYGTLAVRSAFLKCHHPAEFFTALLDVYPEKSKYVAAARTEGFRFLPPDVNISGAGFTLDRATGSIRVGLARIKGLGPVGSKEIMVGQPFSTYEDFRARTTSRGMNKKKVEILAEIGALESLGIKGTADDSRVLQLLGFLPKKPKALRKIKPRHVGARLSDRGWHHRGRERGAELTEGRASVSKVFWIPALPEKEILELKASPYAQVKTWLLTMVDENGIAFQVMADEDKHEEARMLKILARKCQDSVVCLEGRIRKPFLTDGPLGFSFYGISGASFNDDPQMWGVSDDMKLAMGELHRQKWRNRRAA